MNKPTKFDKHQNVKGIFETLDLPDVNTNARFKFSVKVGNKFAFRDVKNVRRYSLGEKENYFYNEAHARESLALFKSQGAIMDKVEDYNN